MREVITNVQMQAFLNDFENNSEITILEEGKEKNEILQIAKAKGINLKGNRDLAGFKCIYTFADKANKNRVRLPKETLLKALPSMIGKPIDIDHDRRYVVGHYIDYRYKQKENMAIGYGIFYKSCFADEWEEAKKLFKAKKLATSYEIWCPKNKRKQLDDGTYELLEQDIAGGAILLKDEPAFPGAKVLEIAKTNMEKSEDLVFASEYKCKDLLINGESKCYNCGKCENADGKKEVITSNISVVTEERKEETIPSKIKCDNCNEEFEYKELEQVKCPKCFAIVDREGKTLYPPQIRDFKIQCPTCKIDNWLILKNDKKIAKIRCQTCAKEYKAEFSQSKVADKLKDFSFVYSGNVSCYQCNELITFSGISNTTKRIFKCKKCGLEFSYDISKGDRYKQIAKITEATDNLEKSNKGGQEMEFTLEVSKYHRYYEGDIDKYIEELNEDYSENSEIEEAARLTQEKRKALPDSAFAVVVRVKDKKTGETRKIRKYPIHDAAHVRNALARLGQPKAKATLKKLGVSVEAVKKKVKAKAKKFGITTAVVEPKKVEKVVKDKVVEDKTKDLDNAKIIAEKDEEITKLNKSLDEVKKEIEEAKKKVEFYKSSAKEIVNRRQELGEEFSKDLSDEDVLNEDKFARAKAEKETALLKAKLETSDDDIVGSKKISQDDDYYTKKRAEINKKAFGE